jgi:tetrahydromethanopterin S-methyltransferase subunit D
LLALEGCTAPAYRKRPMSVIASFVVKALDLVVVTLIFTALS